MQILMSAPLRLPRVIWTRNAPILLAHTAVLATLGTLVTGTDAQVRKLGQGNVIRELTISSCVSVRVSRY